MDHLILVHSKIGDQLDFRVGPDPDRHPGGKCRIPDTRRSPTTHVADIHSLPFNPQSNYNGNARIREC